MKRVLISIATLLVLGGSSLGFTIWHVVIPTKGAVMKSLDQAKADLGIKASP